MSSTDFTVKILGDAANAKKVIDQFGGELGKAAGGWGSMFKNAASTAGGVLGALGIEKVAQQAADFGAQSVEAFKEAQDSQALLEQAYAKFPAIADVNIDKLRELNTALQSKTGYDDDQIAASQATLAQFGLTGDEISKLTPLMLDYAAKTGSDLTTSAEAMGKAVLGQGRALKSVGIDFTDTGSSAGNLDQIMSGLQASVGGTAETLGATGAGQARVLEATFGDLQETIGEKLLPIIMSLQSFLITELLPAISGVVGWVSDNVWVLGVVGSVIAAVLAPAFIAWAAGIWATTVALLANPIVWIVLAIIALIAAIVLLVTNWDAVVAWITQVWAGFVGWITDGLNAFGAWWNAFWTLIGVAISSIWDGFVSWVTGVFLGFVGWLMGVGATISSWWNGLWSGIGDFFSSVWRGITDTVGAIGGAFSSAFGVIGGIVKGAFDAVLGGIRWYVNMIIDAVNTIIAGINTVVGAAGSVIGLSISIPSIPHLAAGTVTNGPMIALVGDNPGGREVVSPLDTYQDELRRAYTAGASSSGGASSVGPVRLAREDLDYLAEKLSGGLYDSIRLGSKRAITTALRG